MGKKFNSKLSNLEHILETKAGKWSLICHSLHNAKYRDIKIKLFDPTKESHILKNISEFRCEDLRSAYHQFPLDEESILLSGIKVFGRILVFQTLYYGTSAAVVIVNTINNMAASAEGIRANIFVIVYIDDILQSGTSDCIIRHFEELGYFFSITKSQSGSFVIYLGLEMNSREKTIRICEKTFEKFTKSLRENMLYKSDGKACMIFEDFQSLVGILVRLSKTSVSGLVNAFSVLGKLAEVQEDAHKVVEFNDVDLKELEYWSSERHILPMSDLSICGASLKRGDSDFSTEPGAKKKKLLHTSDSSGSYWGARSVIDGQDVGLCGEIPEHLLGKPICVLEAHGAEMLITRLLKPATSSVIGTDSTVFDACFRKKRSKNEDLNKILGRIFEHMKKHQIEVKTTWIPTESMASWGSDSLSRRKYNEYEDKYGLSQQGVEFIKETYGQIDLDLFSSPLDNCFKVYYCSNLCVDDDSQNLKMNAWEFLSSEKMFTKGAIWAFPPDNAVEMLIKKFCQLNWNILKTRVRVLLVIREKHVPFVSASLKSIVELEDLELKILQKGHKPATNLKIKTAETFFIVVFGKKVNEINF